MTVLAILFLVGGFVFVIFGGYGIGTVLILAGTFFLIITGIQKAKQEDEPVYEPVRRYVPEQYPTTDYKQIIIDSQNEKIADLEREIAELKRKPKINSISKDMDEMTGVEFERYCALLLENNGYTDVHTTQASGDHGVDILARWQGQLCAVQCKCYKGSVGFDAVKEVFTGKAIHNAEYAMVMTNSHFTQQAIEDANKLGVILFNREAVQELDRSMEKVMIPKSEYERNVLAEDTKR